MQGGSEWLIDAQGCAPHALRQITTVRGVCETIVEELQLHVLGEPQWHQFAGPAGVTGLYLLSESHLTCHTFPECGLATFNLYCCRPKPAWPWEDRLVTMLGAEEVQVRCFERLATSLARKEPWMGGYGDQA